MRYDHPPYPCPGCGQARKLSLPAPGDLTGSVSSGGTGQPVAYCASCPAQDARGNPIGVLAITWSEAIRESLRRAGKSVAEDLDSMAGLVPRQSDESIGLEIRQCWAEQTRSRGGKGGSSSSKGRKKNRQGGAVFPGSTAEVRGDDQADRTRTSKAKPKRKLTSSVHSARLDGTRRRKLRELQESRGASESEAIGQAIDLAHAVETARRDAT